MRVILVFMFWFLVSSAKNQDLLELSEIREMYYKASYSEKGAKEFAETMNAIQGGSSLITGYKGMAELMLCNHVFNPFTKLSHFNKGKQLLENAIKITPNNIELHYLRFTVQTNVPSFIGYNQNIEEDKEFLFLSLPELKDQDLSEKIVEYLLSSSYCTENEKIKLKDY